MDVDASIEQVAGILLREGFEFDTANDGKSYRLLFGSAAVFINFTDWGSDGVVITVSSPIVQEIDPEGPGAAVAHTLLNELNASHYFVKFVFANGVFKADYDLLGDTLQAGELRNAILAVATSADNLDDDLAERLGGKKYETVLEEWALEEEQEDA